MTAQPDRTYRGRMLILAICCLSLFMVGMDTTIVNIALPTIAQDLRAGISGLQWTIDAYALVLGSLLMLSGSLADRLGRRRVFLAGLALFGCASLLCSLAPDINWLIAFRAIQGIGGSMLNPVALSIISNVFTDDRERARAVGVWGGMFGLSMALGPLVGGLLLGASLGWRSLFWVNVPIALVALLLTARFVPESRAAHPRRVDPVGQVLVIGVLTALTYAIIEGPDTGWTSPTILACVALAALALIGLLIYEPRHAEPLLELRLFASVPFSGATAIALIAFAAVGGFALLTTLYLQEVRGYSALHAGLLFVPVAAAAMISGPLSGRLVANRGARLSLLGAGAAFTLCAVMLTGLTATTSVGWLLVAYVVFGLGFGLVSAPVNNTALSGMPRAQSGVAAAIVSTGRQVGMTLGVAVAGALLASSLHGSIQAGLAPASHPAWWVMAGAGVLVIALALITTSAWARRTAIAVGRVATGSAA
ncbi:MAG: MFS transporter [Candidatus Limnocylindrales bacterium]